MISAQALKVLRDTGYVDASNKDVTVASKGKKSKGKTYFVKDSLAFIAWDMLGISQEDKDFQEWKRNKKE